MVHFSLRPAAPSQSVLKMSLSLLFHSWIIYIITTDQMFMWTHHGTNVKRKNRHVIETLWIWFSSIYFLEYGIGSNSNIYTKNTHTKVLIPQRIQINWTEIFRKNKHAYFSLLFQYWSYCHRSCLTIKRFHFSKLYDHVE